MALTINLKMYEHGWAGLIFQTDEQKCHINLSDVFDPFKEIVAWGESIDQGTLPAILEIDEEGHIMILSAKSLDFFHDQAMIELTCIGSHLNKIYLSYHFNRNDFAALLKQEIIRFFQEDFNPSHWSEYDYDPKDEVWKPATLMQDILNHPWICHV